MIMKTIKELSDYLRQMPRSFVVLITVSAEDYARANTEILKVLANDDNLPGLYITINKPYITMKRSLDEAGVKTDRIFFIDCITKTAGGKPEDDANVLYLDSPQNLTGLGVAMAEALSDMPSEDKYKFLFMDSLSTLLLYHNAGTVAKFSHFLTSKMRVWGLRGVLMSVEKETDPEFVNQLSQFCDTVLKLEGKNG